MSRVSRNRLSEKTRNGKAGRAAARRRSSSSSAGVWLLLQNTAAAPVAAANAGRATAALPRNNKSRPPAFVISAAKARKFSKNQTSLAVFAAGVLAKTKTGKTSPAFAAAASPALSASRKSRRNQKIFFATPAVFYILFAKI